MSGRILLERSHFIGDKINTVIKKAWEERRDAIFSGLFCDREV